MDIERIGQLISSNYQDVQSVADGPVFRASFKHHEAPVGIYYFDCSKSLLRPTFDLGEYQERLLSNEYYEQSGPLQWNLYLYLLCDDDEYARLLNDGLVSRIESDGIYAKKYVTSEELLRQELALRTEKWHREAADLPEDISARWLEVLEKHGLAEVADQRVSGKEVFRRYMDDSSSAAPKRRKKKLAEGAAELGFVRGLKLDSQRSYPLEREFEFGPVNLIEGANGAGKTSLLEAIELWTCGRSFRNQNGQERADDVWLKLNHTYERGRRPGDNELFRSRDLLWYGHHQSKGTDLCYRFNRFNFYNTDAAIHITNASDSDTLNRAIADLVLGEEANVIESRLRTLLSYLEPEHRANKKDVEVLKAQIKEAKEALKSLGSAPEGGEEPLDDLKVELRRLGLQISVGIENEESLEALEHELKAMTARVEECRAELSWLPTISLTIIRNEDKRLEALLKEVALISRQSDAGSRRLGELQETVETLKSDLAVLDAWQRYLFNESTTKLRGLEETINQVLKHKNACNEASEVVTDINVVKYLEASDLLKDVEDREKKRERKLQTEIGKLKREARQIEKEWGQISALLSEIREKSHQLIRINPGIESCPVCGNAYEIGELVGRLADQREELAQPIQAQDIQARLSQAELETSDVADRLDELQRLRYAYSLLVSPEEEADWRLSTVAQRLGDVCDELSRINQELDDLTWLKARLGQDGLTEIEYESLRTLVRNKFPDAPLTYEHKADFDHYKARLARTIEEQESALRETEAMISDNLTKREALYQDYLGTAGVSTNTDFELTRHAAQLKRWEPVYSNILNRIGLSPEQSVADVSVRLREAKATCERHADSRKLLERTVSLRANYEAKRKDAESRMPEAKRRSQRAGEAISVINSILVSDNTESHLQKFFEVNTIDIFEIYRLLHAPREFTDVEYDEVDGKIVLVRNSGEKSLLTQISSGQRAALSMSIFLSLNRKLRNGPPFILLDDPVALVDDLNVLSFIDYLRDIVIAGERQIFFATANQKVATLFRKKFAFLKKEFKDIRLIR
jgi:DNA repair exonuclease SbcCD ATPase subunit